MINFSTKTPEQLFALLSDLEDAMATGVYSIAQDGRTITFRTMSEMTALQERLINTLGLNPKPKVNRILRGVVRIR